jgi:hypothetical protein
VPKQLVLADDGRVVVRTKTDEWILERPTLGEYRKLVELTQSADEMLRAALAEVPEGPDQAQLRLDIADEFQKGSNGRPAIYAQLVVQFVAMLAEGDPPEVDDLPSWAVTSRPVARMIAHWRSVPLDLGPDDGGQ